MQKHLYKLKDLIEANLKYLLGVILLSVPLYPKFPLFFIPNVTVAVRIEDFLILIASILWGYVIIFNLGKFLRDKINLSIFTFFYIGLASVIIGYSLTETTALAVGILHLARRVEYLMLFFIAVTAIKKKEDIYFFIRIIFVITLYTFIYGYLQKYYELPIITTQNQEYAKGQALTYRQGGHLVSTFAGHYDLASYIVLTAPIFYMLLFSTRKNLEKIFSKINHYWSRAIIVVLILMNLWLLVNAASRISIAAYLGVAVCALIIFRKYLYIPIIVLLILVFVNMSSNLLARYMNLINVAVDKVMTMEVLDIGSVYAQDRTPRPTPTPAPPPPIEDRSTSIRLNIEWPRALRALRKNPLFGTGYASITLATDNDYLRMLGETGILGFSAFFTMLGLMVAKIIKTAWKISKKSIEYIYLAGIISALPGIFLIMVFIDVLEASKFAIVFWMLMGLAIGLSQKISEKWEK